VRASFVTSAAGLADRPQPRLPEFAFVGRSNCGKSSLINHFLGQAHLAHTSRQPGKTRLLNYFLVEGPRRFYVVDLPGYGYAKVSQTEREAWGRLIRAYLGAGDRLLGVFHLLDIRHRPSEQDREMSWWLRERELPFAIAVTKTDKVGRPRWPAHLRAIVEALDLAPDTPFIPTSAARGQGRREMLGWIDAVLEAGGTPGA
jgi:GTP-binding protein